MSALKRAELCSRIDTERLCIEPIAGRHAALMFSATQDPAIYTWISLTPAGSATELEVDWNRAASRLLVEHGDEVYLNWAVRRLSDGAWIGKMDADVDARWVATNMGFYFFPPFWRQGYATEAVCALSSHLSRNGIRQQRATVTDGNTISSRVLQRAGFERTRVLPGNDTIRGVIVDDIEYLRGE